MNKEDQFELLDKITNSVENLDKDELKSLLSYIIKLYVIDKKISYEGNIIDKKIFLNNKVDSFADLIKVLKNNYDFPELENLVIDNDEVKILIEGKKYNLTIKKNNNEIKNNELKQDKVEKSVDDFNKSNPERFKNIEMDF